MNVGEYKNMNIDHEESFLNGFKIVIWGQNHLLHLWGKKNAINPFLFAFLHFMLKFDQKLTFTAKNRIFF